MRNMSQSHYDWEILITLTIINDNKYEPFTLWLRNINYSNHSQLWEIWAVHIMIEKY